MNNSYLNILLIWRPLRSFSLWQILNRKIHFSTLLLQTCYLVSLQSRSQDGCATKPDQIDTSLYSRKSPKLTQSPEIRNRRTFKFERPQTKRLFRSKTKLFRISYILRIRKFNIFTYCGFKSTYGMTTRRLKLLLESHESLRDENFGGNYKFSCWNHKKLSNPPLSPHSFL